MTIGQPLASSTVMSSMAQARESRPRDLASASRSLATFSALPPSEAYTTSIGGPPEAFSPLESAAYDSAVCEDEIKRGIDGKRQRGREAQRTRPGAPIFHRLSEGSNYRFTFCLWRASSSAPAVADICFGNLGSFAAITLNWLARCKNSARSSLILSESSSKRGLPASVGRGSHR